MKQYLDALQYILENGEDRGDRTGTGTRSVFGYHMRFDLREGFPAVTSKKLAWKSVVSELLWFLEGSDDERRLAEILYGKPREEIKDKTTIWTANANKQGVELGYMNTDTFKGLGPVYGVQWRHWFKIEDESLDRFAIRVQYPGSGAQLNNQLTWKIKPIDQIAQIVDKLKNNPEDRRIILSAWNVSDIDEMALPPCHMMAQFYVSKGKYLSCQMNQRSCDMALGIPFNIASYALLTHMLAHVTGLEAGELIMVLGDAHIYLNHIDGVKEQLKRVPGKLPELWLNPEVKDIDSFTMDDIKLIGYNSQDIIKFNMAV